MTEKYVPDFKMEYSKNFKQKKYVPGARKVEPGNKMIKLTRTIV